ncbi:MAG TPA: NB-ARC domain-containing protein [Ornithinibacter sp.]|nr:NB-ARC domain-containing protein [Ornithinibacter sp.]
MTDIEGSTRLFRELGEDYVALLETHTRLLSEAFGRHGGVQVDTEGDALVVAFDDAAEAVTGCVEGQLALESHPWAAGAVIRVRMGLHSAEAEPKGDNYVSLGLHQAARICAGGHGGQILLSEVTAGEVRNRLPADVGLALLGSFQLRGFAEPARLFQVNHPDLQAQFPPLRVQGVVHHNLPFHRSAFVGRTAERALLASMVRRTGVVTVVGVGGVGKTRLAVQVAFDLIDDFEDGAWLVELSSATDRHGVAGAVAAVLGLIEVPGRDLEDVVVAELSAKSALVLLDNCEQVLEPVAAFTEVLTRRSPHVVVVATSREPLAVEGEVVCRLDPLPVPDAGVEDADELRRADAVRLFEERAGLARPGFEVSHDNAHDVAVVVRRLDGIPLAVELAAAALADRSLAGVVAGLSDRFALLTDGRRTAPERHQTLRAALEWSLDLLAPEERLLFARLGSFARVGGVDAVREVCGGPPLHETDVQRLLRRLARSSLLSMGDDDRWTMLGSVHELAVLELGKVGEASDLAARHRGWFAQRAELLGPQIGLSGRGRVMADLAADLDNVRQALASGAAAADADVTLRLAAAMGPFWTSHGDWSAGVHHLQDALALDGGSDLARGRALTALGNLLILRGDMDDAEAALSEGRQLAHAEHDETTVARSTSGLGYVAFRRSDLDTAELRWREALDHSERAGDERVTAGILRSLAIAAGSRGDQVAAGALLDRGIRSAEHAHDDQLLRLLLGSRAEIDLWTGRYPEAQHLYGQALDLASAVGDLSARPLLLCELGWVALLTGELETSERLASEAAELAEDLGNRRTLASALRLRGEVLVRRGAFARAGSHLDRALEVAEGLSAPAEIAGVVCSQAFAALERLDLTAAQRLAEAALDRTRLGHAMRPVFPQWVQGVAALSGGAVEEAARRFRAGIEHTATETSPRHQANSRWGLACVHAMTGRPGEAARLHREALEIRHAIGDRLGVAESLAAAASLVAPTDPATAQRLARSALSLRVGCGAVPTPRQAAQESAAWSLVGARDEGSSDRADAGPAETEPEPEPGPEPGPEPAGTGHDAEVRLATEALRAVEDAEVSAAG